MPHPSGPCVLVVEDNETLLETITAVFEKQGLSVLSATTGEDALALLRERGAAVDWLFTDVRLPGGIDGWRVAEEFRFAHPFRPPSPRRAAPSAPALRC